MITTIRVHGYPSLMQKFVDSHTNFDQKMVRPNLSKLHRKFQSTFNSLFSAGASAGMAYRHGDTGKYLSMLRHRLTNSMLQEIEYGKGGKFIREGTSGQANNPPTTPYGAVEWAQRKLGVSKRDAFAVARYIAREGIGKSSKSPLRREHPVGQGRFAFPEWMVTMKHKADLEDTARNIGSMFVSYIG